MMKFNIKKITLILVLSFAGSQVFAQKTNNLKYISAQSLTISGKGISTTNTYDRVDTAKYKGLPPRVAQLLTNSAGLAIRFTTNSTVISAKWCVTRSRPSTVVMPVTQKGVDLYIKNGNQWQFAGIGKATVNNGCNEEIIISRMDNSEKECLLYLPLFDAVTGVEIGIDRKAEIKAAAEPFAKKVLIYGSSIVHGTGASRPGMAYPARLSRLTGINFINLGVTGSAKMEPEVADMIAQIDADAYILDCVPNTNPDLIKERTAYLVNTIRKKQPGKPIIVMQSVVRESGYWDKVLGQQVKNQNINIQQEVLALLQKDVKDLYFITSENMLGTDHEGTVDGVHPSDLGYDRMVRYLQPLITEVLSKYDIKAQ
ncbi:SGNH/GDSL hydrolase family protein [Desertivirga xinjiangensis]|uniref:SGNH/GDSL hydrolase family protein n=1 Tax=Desertivirga xinjiangensis TaxID=539206 RepID=UPI00210C6E04|nr:SGNH/GDSL hydrolase family protein [Pedobacter xinjiangensis]